MSYNKSTIADIIEGIDKQMYLLPIIQRNYVWGEEQIEKLFDSIMNDYPFGTFIFWKIKKEIANKEGYRLYKFVKDYHERDTVNEIASQPFTIYETNEEHPNDYIYGVLDGQQRLTSLYISLKGCLQTKLPNKKKANDSSYPKKELYFDLSSDGKEIETGLSYKFKFFTNEEITEQLKTNKWYKVKDILSFKNDDELQDFIFINYPGDILANRNLKALYKKFKEDEIITYYELKNDSQDETLDIFVRINSAGTVLSKTDFLFSKIVLKWNDGREEIETLIKEINKINNGYSYSTDFVMRTCLYLVDKSASLKIKAFKDETINTIKNNWNEIKSAIKDSLIYLNDNLGVNAENLISDNVILPIMYFRYKNKKAFDEVKNKTNENVKEIKKYITISQTNHVFGQSTNQALEKIRDKLNETPGVFSLKSLQGIVFSSGITMKFNEDNIKSWFDEYEKGPYTFMILSFLYPDIKFNQYYHQDHMHPYNGFEKKAAKELKKKNLFNTNILIDDEKIKEWKSSRNKLANLQLLTGRENIRKQDTPLKDWLASGGTKDKYLPNVDLDVTNFDEFLVEREKLMISELKKQLGV